MTTFVVILASAAVALGCAIAMLWIGFGQFRRGLYVLAVAALVVIATVMVAVVFKPEQQAAAASAAARQ